MDMNDRDKRPSLLSRDMNYDSKNYCFQLTQTLKDEKSKIISIINKLEPGNTNGGSIIVPLTSCLTGLD